MQVKTGYNTPLCTEKAWYKTERNALKYSALRLFLR